MVNRNYINTDKIKNFAVVDKINEFMNAHTPYPCSVVGFGIPLNFRQGYLMLKVCAPNGNICLHLRDFDCKYDFIIRTHFEDENLFKIYEDAWVEFMKQLFKDDHYEENLQIYREEKQAKLAAAANSATLM